MPHHLPLADTQRQEEEWENFVIKNKEAFRCALTGGCWPREAASEVTRSRTPCGWLFIGCRQGQKLRELSIMSR